MEINLPCVVIAPNKKKVYKSYIGCQERILSCRVLFHTVKTRFTPDTLSIRTPHFMESLLCPWENKALIISLNSTGLIRTPRLYGPFSMVPSVSVLTEFDCRLHFTL